MGKTLPILVCALLVLSTSPRLYAQNANLAVETNRWPPFKATIDGPFPPPKYNDPPTIKSVSLDRFAKYGRLNKFILPERLSVEREKNGFLLVRTRFRFTGPKLESRRIELEVEALDQSGRVLSKAYARCSDARLAAGKPTGAASSTTIQALPFNEPVIELELPVGVDQSATRVEVEFREPS